MPLPTPESTSDKQRLSVELAECRMNLWEGSVRSGKTAASLLAWLYFVLDAPPGNLVMIGKTERTLKRNIIDELVDWLGPQECRYVAGNGELYLMNRRIYIAGANDAKAEDKIRGLTLLGAYVDEVSLMPEGMFKMLLTRLSIDGARLFGTTNPDNPRHWLMRDYLRKFTLQVTHRGDVKAGDRSSPETLDLARFSFRLDDNPSLPQVFRQNVEREFTGLYRLRMIEGLWVLAEGAIYDTFDPEPGRGFVVANLPDIDRWVVAVDYGTTNPFVALLIGLGVDDRLYVAREWRWDSRARKRQMTDRQYSREVRSWLDRLESDLPGCSDPEQVIVDPSAASFILQLHQDGWTGVRKANNAVESGIRTVSSLRSAGRLLVHESCEGIDELSGYVWDPKAAERGVEQPLKVDDHYCLVAGTQVETSTGPVPIERVAPGDLVWTREGLRPVIAAGMTARDVPVLGVEVEGVGTLVGTGSHPVWVEGSGWVRMDALRYGDMLHTWAQQSLSSSSGASSSGGTPSRRSGQTACTSLPARPTASAGSAGSTKKSGRRRTGRYLPGITSTTPTSIRSTTTCRTWCASLTQTIAVFIVSVLSSVAEGTRRANAPGQLPPNGTGRTKDGRGTASTPVKRGKVERRSPEHASTAASGTNRSIPAGSARTPASRRGGEPQGSTTSPCHANAATPSSLPTGTTGAGSARARVLHATDEGRADVYNLTVDGCPEFYADGVLVHNCDAERYGVMGTWAWWRDWLTIDVDDAGGDEVEAA